MKAKGGGLDLGDESSAVDNDDQLNISVLTSTISWSGL